MSDFNSFYGGKQGFSFVLARSYESIAEMVKNFKKGVEYREVVYEEYVLINTPNKNNPENGKVYRRGYEYTNDMGGAIYIGTIVGPAGRAPMLELDTIENVKAKQNQEGYDDRYTEGEYSVPQSALLPGKTSSGEYNDSIKWACCCVRNENGEDSTAYIGFKIPYLVVDYSAQSVSPYYNRSNATDDFINERLIDRLDDASHPFWEHWNIKVPKGLKGDTFKDFRVIPASEVLQDYDGKSDDVENNREVLVYDYYHYDKDSGGEPVSIYLGDYNMIDNMVLDEEGTVTIAYSHDDTDIYPNLFKWIKTITLDKENGHFKIVYNYDEKNGTPTVYETDLSWVSGIEILPEGVVEVSYSTGETESLDTTLRWITKITTDADGTLTVYYNDGTTNVFDKKIQWIDEIKLDQNGDFTVHYNNEEPDYTTNLTWPVEASLTKTGVFTIKYNNDTPDYVENLKWTEDVNIEDNGDIEFVYNDTTNKVYDKYLKVIKDITIETADESGEEGSGDQKIHVEYNTGDSSIIGEPLNYIIKTAITPDYHYLVYYSDPEKRASIVEEGSNYVYDGLNDWADLGSIKDDSGLLIGLNYSLEEYPDLNTVNNAVSFLNQTYPDGLLGELKGKIITVGNNEGEKRFFAFDYSIEDGNYKGWYYLGNLSIDLQQLFIVAEEDDPDIEKKKVQLSNGGLWFILSE